MFAVFDYLKSYLFSGFQTNVLGCSQASFIQLIQITDVFGVFSISFFIVLINMTIYYYLTSRNKKFLIQIFFVFSILISYGFYRIKQFDTDYGNKISVGII